MTDPNWPRPADEPRSQPFQPVSYSFDPEFLHEAPPAPTVQQQPVFPGVPPQAPHQPAPKRSRRGLKITLAVVGSVIVLCGIGTTVAAIPVVEQYRSSVTAPDQVPGGLTKSTDADLQTTVEDLRKQLNSELSTGNAVAAYYDSTPTGQPVLFAAASTLVLFPGTQLNDAFKSLNTSDLPVTDVRKYPSGSLGGTVKCGASTSSGVKLALCVWADYGSMGIAAMFGRTPAAAEPLFLQIREATETR